MTKTVNNKTVIAHLAKTRPIPVRAIVVLVEKRTTKRKSNMMWRVLIYYTIFCL